MAKARKKGVSPEAASESSAPPATAPAAVESAQTLDPERIAMRAYELYLERGAVDGAAMEDWLLAEEELKRRK
jgi:hypothetical protein